MKEILMTNLGRVSEKTKELAILTGPLDGQIVLFPDGQLRPGRRPA